MKIFIPFKIKDIGGTSIFASIFSKELKKRNIEIVFDFCKDFDILFIIADCPLRYVFYAKWKKKKIIQRLHGVYNFATNGWLYPLLNIKIKLIYNWLSDSVVYQSKFSRFSCEKILGKTKAKETTIIYNGVDTKKIRPRASVTPSDRIKLITFAKFRRRDQIEPIIESVKLLDKEKFSLDIYGTYTENLKCIFESLPNNVIFKDKLSHENLLGIINQYDIFLFSDQSACPNSVLEALGSGLPVVAYSRGSIDELIETDYNGEILPLKRHNSFIDNYPFGKENYKELDEKIEKISQNLEFYKNNARKSALEKFSLNNMINSYIASINKIMITKK